MPVLELSLANTFDALPPATGKAGDFLRTNGASTDAIFAANLAIEELVTNAIKYAFADVAPHQISVRLTVEASELHIEISDDGRPFNPFEHPAPDLTLPAAERPLGGLGIHFVRKLLDTCAYERRDGRNVVRLVKRL